MLWSWTSVESRRFRPRLVRARVAGRLAAPREGPLATPAPADVWPTKPGGAMPATMAPRPVLVGRRPVRPNAALWSLRGVSAGMWRSRWRLQLPPGGMLRPPTDARIPPDVAKTVKKPTTICGGYLNQVNSQLGLISAIVLSPSEHEIVGRGPPTVAAVAALPGCET